MEPSEPRKERRLHQRETVFKTATIMTDPTINCSVRNQHERGAELLVPAESLVPDRFLLKVPADGTIYQAVARWRRRERLGVQFYGVPEKFEP
ncbi:PilZ domain-containing protein [Mesorhizobium sp. B1-1-8]|uniref:PilZ domain-containing protein n=1 Tax=Mesorhizobium sp. B1-1-8 TaxID=2589976 RepID=UPI00112C3826|nr:PilZ domain-containing protein [Mesorhizobium sp. B1-1-8]UCI06409.1 PilZ domain-containing protein [Mesorhizobium sp. B1-1-8]